MLLLSLAGMFHLFYNQSIVSGKPELFADG